MGGIKLCEECQQPTTKRRGYQPKFCGAECQKKAISKRMIGNSFREGLRPVNAFTKGNSVWNKDLKGIHLSPGSEFKKGRESTIKEEVGTISHRQHKKDSVRAWIKVAHPNVWKRNAIFVWEQANGVLPRGWVVHHKNRNPLDDSLENLQAMTKSEHAKEHQQELIAKRNMARKTKALERIDAQNEEN